MKQRIICKALAVAVILLFIGMGIQPAVATVEQETIENNNDAKPSQSKICCDSVNMLFGEAPPSSTIYGKIFVYNCGEPGSYLNWSVDTEAVPTWGYWTFEPESGTSLAEGDCAIINVTFVLTDCQGLVYDIILVYNDDEPSKDYCEIETGGEIRKARSYLWFLERFPMLGRLMNIIF